MKFSKIKINTLIINVVKLRMGEKVFQKDNLPNEWMLFYIH